MVGCPCTADVKDCMRKIHTLKYGEEGCYNGTLVIKAFSSGLEIGTCNWTISSPKRNITCLSSSIFVSSHAMNFDYCSLQGNDTILFSDFSSMNVTEVSSPDNPTAVRIDGENLEEFATSVLKAEGEILEEIEKLAFICSCAVDSVKAGGSVLVPIGQLGIVLQLLEQVSLALESSNLKVYDSLPSTPVPHPLSFLILFVYLISRHSG